MLYNDASSTFRFSLRELIFFITFLCVLLGSSMTSGVAMPLVFLNGVILAFAVLSGGKVLCGWMIAGVLTVPLLFIDMLAAWDGRKVVPWQALTPDLWIAVCLATACGSALGLRNSGKELLPMLLVAVAMIDFIWLMLPRINEVY